MTTFFSSSALPLLGEQSCRGWEVFFAVRKKIHVILTKK